MDAQLLPALHGSLSADPQQRGQAEAVLEQLSSQEGYCAALLHIASQPERDAAIRQNAAICLKNAARRRWSVERVKAKGNALPVPQSDKDAIKARLHACTARSPRPVQKQLLETVRQVAVVEYPGSWPSLIPEALASLASPEPAIVYGSLLVLRKVASGLEFTSIEKRGMAEFCSNVLPTLVALLQRLLAEEARPDELALLLRAIVKVLWSCLYMQVPAALVGDESLSRQLLAALLALLRMPLLGAPRPADMEAAARSPWWKLRKWAIRLASHIFSRYSEPKLAPRGKDGCAAFAVMFQRDFSLAYLKVVMEMVTQLGQGAWCSKHVTLYIFQYLTEAVKQESTAKWLEPYLLDVLVHVALPLTAFSAELQQEWEDDPMEVIRKNSASLCAEVDLYDPRDKVVNFVLQVVKRRRLRTHLLDPFMEHVVGVASAFTAAQDQGRADDKLAYQMDGAVLIFGMLLETVLMKVPKYNSAMEGMATRYLVPLFGSPQPFLRAKACWLAGKYADKVHFRQPDGSERQGDGALFDQLFHLVLSCMQDADLPVQVEAVNAFRDFVEALSGAQRLEAQLQPLLAELLRHLFRLAGTVEAMDVVMSVDTIVEKLKESIQPYALHCCQELVGVYAKVLSDRENDDEEDYFMEAAFHILKPIIKLLDACTELPETLRKLEDAVTPMLEDMLVRSPEDVLDQVCEVLSYFTYFLTPISERMWHFWGRLETCLKAPWGVDYTENVIVPLDNFITRGQDVFCGSTRPDYRASLYDIVKHLLADSSNDEQAVKPIVKLVDAMLLSCPGRVDDWLWPFLQLAAEHLPSVRSPSFATLRMNVLPAALIYNGSATLRLLEANGLTARMFELWFKMLQDQSFFRRLYDKKLTCVGLANLLALPESAIPRSLAPALTTIFQELVRKLRALKEQEDLVRADGSSGDEGDLDGSDSRAALDGDEQDADVDPLVEDQQYMALLEKAQARLAEKHDDEDGLVSFDEWTDDEDVDTALDDVDAYQSVVATMSTLQSSMPDRFQMLMASLDEGLKRFLRDVAQQAHIRQANQEHRGQAVHA